MEVFAGRMYKVGIIRYVDVPKEVSRGIGAAGAHVSVRGMVEGVPLVTTMVSRGKGCYRVAIHGDIRKKLRVDAGAIVEVALERDEGSREPVLPPALVVALRLSPEAQGHFRGMTVSLRRQIVRYITGVKQRATMERRATGMVRRLAQLAREKKENKRAKRGEKIGRTSRTPTKQAD